MPKQGHIFGAWFFAVNAILSTAGHASEVQTYTYDELGRLVTVSSAGNVNDGQKHAICYDPAGNRTRYISESASPGATCISPPSISAASATAIEGQNLSFILTRSGDLTTAVGAGYQTLGGTASSGVDFTVTSGTVSFLAGQAQATVIVPTTDDSQQESAEALTLELNNPTGGAVLANTSATGTITDNDTPLANLSIGNAVATEGGSLSFTVTRSGELASAVSVGYSSNGGTALPVSDFQASSGTLNFAANQTVATIIISTVNDAIPEPIETMTVALTGASAGAAITTANGTGTINDNDSGWASGLTSGVWSNCNAGSCVDYVGYLTPLMGSITNATWSGYSVSGVFNQSGYVYFHLTDAPGQTVPPDSGWTTITIPGVGTLNRTSAYYYSGPGYAFWLWANPNNVASGTVVIQ